MSELTANASRPPTRTTVVGTSPACPMRSTNCSIVLESGSFTAATGFVLKGTDTAAIDEKAIEERVKTTGVVELSLSWR